MRRAALMTTYIITNLSEADAALDYFNGFHDGFIKQLALISHDQFEARGVQASGERLTLEITFAHYNYRQDSKPVDRLKSRDCGPVRLVTITHFFAGR